MTEIADNIWTVNVPELNGEFKFRMNSSWDVNYGEATDGNGSTIADNGQYGIGQNGKNFKSDNAKDVTLILDTKANQLTTKFNSGEATPYALVGAINSWAWNGLYCFTETNTPGVYTLTIPSIDAGSEFKISDPTWNEQFTSEDTQMCALGVYPLKVNDKESSNMAYAYHYDDLTLTLDANKNTLVATAPVLSGISQVETAVEEAAYYNLQGVKVENPGSGLYIRVSGNKAEKVYVR